jgi:hypothetical protein
MGQPNKTHQQHHCGHSKAKYSPSRQKERFHHKPPFSEFLYTKSGWIPINGLSLFLQFFPLDVNKFLIFSKKSYNSIDIGRLEL